MYEINSFDVSDRSHDAEVAAGLEMYFRAISGGMNGAENVDYEALARSGIRFVQLKDGGELIASCYWKDIDGVAILDGVVVDPDLRRKKIGSLLVEAFEQDAREMNAKSVWLNSNKASIVFYEKNGYEHTGEESARNPMTKPLS